MSATDGREARAGARSSGFTLLFAAGCVGSALGAIALILWAYAGGANASRQETPLEIATLVLLACGVAAAGVHLRESAESRLRRRHLAELEELARRDGLCDVYNYRYLRERLRAAVRESAGLRCSLVMLDLDNFKGVNDRFGHLVGDRVLAVIGRAMRDEVGGRGVVARYGGDEFAILLPGMGREEAAAVAKQVARAIGAASVAATSLNQHLSVGASYGIAEYPQDAADDESLIGRADRVLYEAKSRKAEVIARTEERHAQEVFFAIGEAMGQSLDAQETVDNLVRAVGESLNLDLCAIRLADERGRLDVRAYYAADRSSVEIFRAVEDIEPITRAEAAREGLLARPTYVDDVAMSGVVPERYRTLMAAGTWLLSTPLQGPKEGLVILSASHTRAAPPPAGLADAIARLASAAIHNCEIYEAARRQGEQLSGLAGVGGLLFGDGDFEERLGRVAEQVGKAFGIDILTVDTVDPEGKKPFCRHLYVRPIPGRALDEEIMRTWRSTRPQIIDRESREFLAKLNGPMVLDDASNHPAIPETYRKVLAQSKTNSVVIVPIAWQGELKGLLYFASYRLHAFAEQDVVLMQSVTAQLAPSLQIAALHVELKRSYEELKEAHLEAILRLAYAAEARDPYTGRHLQRIKAFSTALGKEMGLEGEELETLSYGAVVHDLGKLRIPDSILIKAGELTEEEWRVMKRHPEFGAEFLGKSPFYDVARQVAMHHHERWDGSGYPEGLKGEEIPLAARIVSVADVYDALTSDRPYKVAWPPERALVELLQLRGKTLCPYSVDAFLRLWNDGTIAQIEGESGHASFAFDFRERYAA